MMPFPHRYPPHQYPADLTVYDFRTRRVLHRAQLAGPGTEALPWHRPRLVILRLITADGACHVGYPPGQIVALYDQYLRGLGWRYRLHRLAVLAWVATLSWGAWTLALAAGGPWLAARPWLAWNLATAWFLASLYLHLRTGRIVMQASVIAENQAWEKISVHVSLPGYSN